MTSTLRNLGLAAGLLACNLALADAQQQMHEMHGKQHATVQIEHPYVRAVPPGQPNSAAFMTLRNKTGNDNAVIAASSPAADAVELHTHTMDNGMMKMRRIDSIALPAKGSAELKPGGLHIMLIGLKEQLKPGMKVDLTLKFADGSEQSISAPVQEIMQSMGHSMDGHHPMAH